jgi:uncharacterized protein
MFLQVGYGLEGVLPDALCKRIIDEQISPRFKAGDFNGGLTAGVQSIIAAVKGEYKGTGATVADRTSRTTGSGGSIFPFILLVIFILAVVFARGSGIFLPWLLLSGTGSNSNWGGGGFSSGGGFGGGGGGFSGGGGSFGGGGAGGSW